jgi:hypothetical protein
MITPLFQHVSKGKNVVWAPFLDYDTGLVDVAIPPLVASLEIVYGVLLTGRSGLACAAGSMPPMKVKVALGLRVRSRCVVNLVKVPTMPDVDVARDIIKASLFSGFAGIAPSLAFRVSSGCRGLALSMLKEVVLLAAVLLVLVVIALSDLNVRSMGQYALDSTEGLGVLETKVSLKMRCRAGLAHLSTADHVLGHLG